MSYPKVFDAAVPPETAPAGFAGAMGYIGGNTPHVWTPAEWRRFEHLSQFPVWVPNLTADAGAQGVAAANAMKKLGWAAFLPEPDRRVLIIDLEAAQVPAFYRNMAISVEAEGFVPVAYGSLSTVLENAASHVIAAHWDVIPVIPPGQTLHGLQYEANIPFGSTMLDYSVFDAWLFARGGRGARHGA